MAQNLGKLAKRYAKALLDAIKKSYGKEANSSLIGELVEKLEALSEIWEQDKDFSLFVLNPMFPAQERIQILETALKMLELPELIKRFFQVLFTHDRLQAFPEIVASFRKVAQESLGVVEVTVTTATPLSEEEKKSIQGRMKDFIKGSSLYTWAVDSSLLAGMLVDLNGKVIDGTLRGRLERMERSLL